MTHPALWLAVFCAMVFVWQAFKIWKGLACISWPAVRGMVHSVSIEEKDQGDGDIAYSICIEYSYSVAGNAYISHRLAYSETTQLSHEQALERLQGLSAGAKTNVFYNPSRPAESVIQKGVDTLSLIKMGIFGVLGLGLAIGASKGLVG